MGVSDEMVLICLRIAEMVIMVVILAIMAILVAAMVEAEAAREERRDADGDRDSSIRTPPPPPPMGGGTHAATDQLPDGHDSRCTKLKRWQHQMAETDVHEYDAYQAAPAVLSA